MHVSHKFSCINQKDESPRPHQRTGRFLAGLNHGNADVPATTASGSHLRQGDVKRKGADLLVAPLKLNVRLSKCDPRSVNRSAVRQNGGIILIMPPKLKGRLPLWRVCSVKWLRGLVKPRNSNNWPRSRYLLQKVPRSSPNRLSRLSRSNRPSCPTKLQCRWRSRRTCCC